MESRRKSYDDDECKRSYAIKSSGTVESISKSYSREIYKEIQKVLFVVIQFISILKIICCIIQSNAKY